MKKGDWERIASASSCAVASDVKVMNTDARIEWHLCIHGLRMSPYLDTRSSWVVQQRTHPVYLRKLGKVPSACGNVIRKRHQ